MCREIKRLLTCLSTRKKSKANPKVTPAMPIGALDTINTVNIDSNTQFLSILIGYEQVFRVLATLKIA